MRAFPAPCLATFQTVQGNLAMARNLSRIGVQLGKHLAHACQCTSVVGMAEAMSDNRSVWRVVGAGADSGLGVGAVDRKGWTMLVLMHQRGLWVYIHSPPGAMPVSCRSPVVCAGVSAACQSQSMTRFDCSEPTILLDDVGQTGAVTLAVIPASV